MNRIAVVATHHKAGTVWMNHTFRMIGEALGIRVVHTAAPPPLESAERTAPLIFCAAHADAGGYPGLFDDAEVRVLHLIRDPRDILISSMHYHCRADEKWLLRANPELGGRSYREALTALPTERERYAFEMAHSTATNLAELLDWNYGRANSFECRYEDLIRDTERRLFSRIAAHLGFSKEELPVCRRIFWRHAIFGGKAERKRQGKIAHVRSGEPEQWRSVFDRSLGEAFLAQFDDALVRLGYETDASWLDRLPGTRAELDAHA